jgi:hypothetical protein
MATLAEATTPVRVHTRRRHAVLDDLCAWCYAWPVSFQKTSEDYAITSRGREQLLQATHKASPQS